MSDIKFTLPYFAVPADGSSGVDQQAAIPPQVSTVVFSGDVARVIEGFALALDLMAANQDLLITEATLSERELPDED
ncbi:hypothetical protein [Bradyrhizobium arachidis]|uniref:hypothetical protein n=1 Tax=Bradyrhizobium arachidis TaxID=858423 RepID=UPI00216316AB|nr:hypothetical protein [Bradyrhizobium arachidis]UVO29696.1 hypothetical protein KUF59_02685 [Bradyrhizobium arachidis]